ncbi:hypothetical protein Zmor_004883 [Zophobas morio]|uniref:Uncharacterized protein n=1 Tax=Zophobas morio TaxID=2755281 RepID=A0AA38IWQ5_9CUCU|nr:hypothetical protein Zmor_004883 [Zophobas morio]
MCLKTNEKGYVLRTNFYDQEKPDPNPRSPKHLNILSYTSFTHQDGWPKIKLLPFESRREFLHSQGLGAQTEVPTWEEMREAISKRYKMARKKEQAKKKIVYHSLGAIFSLFHLLSL